MLKGALRVVTEPRAVAIFLADLAEEDFRRRMSAASDYRDGLPTVEIASLCGTIDEIVDPYAFLEGGSSTLDLALLKALARRFRDCRYLEIGTWRGESVANVATVAANCVSVSLSDDQLRAMGWSEPVVRVARFFSRGLPNVMHIGGDSESLDWKPFEGRCDLVFVDGDHSYEAVRSDTRNAFRLLRDGKSIVVWHDYCRTPEKGIRWDVLAAILDGAPSDARAHLYHVSNTQCAIYIRASLPTKRVSFPMVPTTQFRVRVQSFPIANSGA